MASRWSAGVTVQLAIQVQRVWEAVQFWGLHRWDPNSIQSSDDGDWDDGSIRCVVFNFPDGSIGSYYEKLTEYDAENYSYSYEMGVNPLGYRGFSSTFKLEEADDGATIVNWSFELDAIEGQSESTVVDHIQGFFRRELAVLEEMALF